ncbi:Asp-tRNA(Asn)/Glu-tRNA(Gln) amidotransferase subunit GatC [Sediminitomix flava]|uniref:Aspartyl/glutamyl-tRNA(Asn/Gln) amidotransferase subunit C n=1 Tax=Sediminitomix flava TaxID=379075 RepID=A0A315ZC33_SEDFL|nr:Asp-tRNA(Asn)/Glu-tRNA(Gln) amidotransferase subunit GatC [Sediminitomix flava]PWJ43135.1 aspartyl/glutamyl-tRNA(Asn/Gln) amidotransferase subunit C [Sediminitomix flava]
MKIDKSTIHKIAHLSRLNFDGKDEDKMVDSLNEIIDWVTKLEEVDTEGVKPLTHMTEEVNVLREDKVSNTLARERGLKNAPKKDEESFRVPKVIE